MSNILKPFGNEGWIQSSIDRSRFKTRDTGKHNAQQANAKRQAAIHADSALLKSYTPSDDAPKRKFKGGLGGLLQKALLKQNDPLVKKYGG